MKYYKTLGIYKNSTGTNNFYPVSETAYSYEWWMYFRPYKGKYIFNNSNYSATTNKHQAALRAVLRERGITDYIVLNNTIRDLSDVDDAIKAEIKALTLNIDKLQKELDNKRCKRSLDERRHNSMLEMALTKVELTKLLE